MSEQEGQKEDLEIIVMPRDGGGSASDADGGLKRSFHGRLFLLLALILLGILLLVGGYYAYRLLSSPGGSDEAPGILLPQPIADDIDTDNDGLTDEEERRFATDPTNPDTDGDGLADGDEVKIYESDPLLVDTDSDGYPDGREVSRGYSPIVNSPDKASPAEIATWERRIAEFGLHEPTITTLRTEGVIPEAGLSTYRNAAYGYEFALPGDLSYREADEGRSVGVYVAGSVPPEGDVLNDPISLSLAVKVAGQTLEEFVRNRYPAGGYEKLEVLPTSAGEKVKITALPGETCPRDETFFSREGTVVVLALNCRENPDFLAFYEQIDASFRFIE